MLGTGRSYQLARLFGIRIGVNVSWFLVLFIFLVLLSDSFASTLDTSDGAALGFALLAALLFFGSIVLHELGHAVAARRCGIEVSGIDLFFFGGVMKMSSDTASPGDEFKVAAAGPAVTLLLCVIGTGIGILVAGDAGQFFDAAVLRSDGTISAPELLVSFLVAMNVVLFVFNLIPAFPLDGGRIARALVWKLTGSRARATRVAASIGQGFGWLVVGFGLVLVIAYDDWNGIWYAALGYLLASSARAAIAQTDFSEKIADITVADVMDADPVTIPASLPADRAYEEFFLRYHGWPWFALVEADGTYAGLAHRAAVEHAALVEGGAMPVRDLVAAADRDSVRADQPLETLLGSESLRTLGALMAVDAQGHLRGVVTVEMVSRALAARLA